MSEKAVRILKRLGIGMLSLAVITAGGIRIVQQYRAGAAYQPDTSVFDRNLNENQVIFSNQNNEQLKSDGTPSKDSELWEQDLEADKKLSQEQIPDTNYLFKTQAQSGGNNLILPGQPQPSLGETDSIGGSDGSQPSGDGTIILDPSADRDTADVVIRVPDGESGTVDGTGSGKNPSDDGNTNQPGPTPDPTPTPGPTPNPEDSIPDPEPIKPGDLLADDVFYDSNSFPEAGLDSTRTDEAGNETKIEYKLNIAQREFYDVEDYCYLYRGETITPEKILALAGYYIYDSENSSQMYLLEDYGECFRLDSYPEKAESSIVTVQFSFRPNVNSAWIHQDYTFPVKDCKIMLLRDGDRRPIELYVNLGETVDLSRYYYKMQPEDILNELQETELYAPNPVITEVFPGWHLQKKANSVGLTYTPTEMGRTILYPMDMVPVSDNMEAEIGNLGEPLISCVLDTSTSIWNTSIRYYYPVITSMPDQEEWDIPEGIICADGGLSLDEFDPFGYWFYHTATTIRIPSTMIEMGSLGAFGVISEALPAQDAYIVKDGNVSYSSEDGILYNEDKTVIEAIPLGRETVVVPDTVTEVQVSDSNQIQTMTFKSTEAPEMELYYLYGTTIYIPQEYEDRYFIAWGNMIANGDYDIRTINAEGEVSEPSLAFENGLLLSSDKTQLYSILSEVQGLFVIPDTVTTIHEDALSQASGLRTIVIPESVQTLEKDSLTSDYLRRIIFRGKVAPDGLKGAWNSDAVACVTNGTVSGWEGDTQTQIIVPGEYGETSDGYTYLAYTYADVNQMVLLHVAGGVTEFNGKTADGNVFTAIGDHAFSNVETLILAELPAELVEIETGAFAGCSSLEGVISDAETITVEEGTFTGCNSLRFLAFSAVDASIADMGQNYSVSIYAPLDGMGYPWQTLTYGTQYVLRPQGVGKILYCMDSRWSLYDATGQVVEELAVPMILSATTNISGEVSLEDDTIAIEGGAFENCTSAFTLANLDALRIIGDYAFAYSGLTGDLYLPELVETIGNSAFNGCTGLTSLTIDGTLLSQINEFAFAGCSGITSITFGENCQLQEIREYAFAGTAITEFDMPDSVRSIRMAIFEECTGLQEIRFSGEVPPALVSNDSGVPYTFGRHETAPYEYVNLDIKLVLQGEAQANRTQYIDTWKEAFGDENWTIPEESAEGEAQ